MKNPLVSSIEEYSGKSVLNTGDDMEDVCPVKLDRPYVEFVCSVDPVALKKRVMDSYKRISEGNDVALVVGAVEYKVGRALGLSDLDVSSALDLKSLMVVKYTSDFVLVEQLIDLKPLEALK